ncbi:hypothetical protein B0H10DRAFT_1197557 [Mycena sp. CBHHK59/15]|nr:hypothetical protein B0H10DRAFT_1197557 [Mycena sp. CBHHK59/15]
MTLCVGCSTLNSPIPLSPQPKETPYLPFGSRVPRDNGVVLHSYKECRMYATKPCGFCGEASPPPSPYTRYRHVPSFCHTPSQDAAKKSCGPDNNIHEGLSTHADDLPQHRCPFPCRASFAPLIVSPPHLQPPPRWRLVNDMRRDWQRRLLPAGAICSTTAARAIHAGRGGGRRGRSGARAHLR